MKDTKLTQWMNAKVASEPIDYFEAVAKVPMKKFDESVEKSLESTYNKVVWLGKKYPDATGEYRILEKRWDKEFGINGNFWKDKHFKKLVAKETVTRMFRKAVKNKDLKPTGKILARRLRREMLMREAMVR